MPLQRRHDRVKPLGKGGAAEAVKPVFAGHDFDHHQALFVVLGGDDLDVFDGDGHGLVLY